MASSIDLSRRTLLLAAALLPLLAASQEPPPVEKPQELHDRIAPSSSAQPRVALTLDACSGDFDRDLIVFLIDHRIPTTIFATTKWIRRNPKGLALLKAHLDLFDIEDHGENHVPAVIGAGRTVYGIPGEPDMLHLRREVLEGAEAIEEATGVPPHWYRGATGEYDQKAANEIRRLGYKIGGFSVNADAGATLSMTAIERRMRHVRSGDVIIAHMNRPKGQTAEGLAPSILELLKRGFTFVRLDQVDLESVP
jgi:peptidoglycan/xylan/chitin deacetylase (PgdA/CDA1 family)